jgi:NADH dehydrogenase FAD-containing subunit
LIQTFGIPTIKRGNGIFFLKQLHHARELRNNIIDSFEKAAVPTMLESERRKMLSFVVVGGGPTSCEFVSELHGTKTTERMRGAKCDLIRTHVLLLYYRFHQTGY